MTLKVIGTGFGRTGTLSLKAALEHLGFGPCYHMSEVFAHPEHVPVWTRAARGERVDFEALYTNYRATVDWPSTHFWRDLIERYPDARIVHTERDPEVWYKSFSQTISEALQRPADPASPMHTWAEMTDLVITQHTFGGDLSKANVLKVYNAHNAEIRRRVPAARLLVHDVKDGWPSLCAHLGVAVPAAPFPKTNSTEEFRARMAGRTGH